jgi:CBS domain-containing protein
MAEKAQILSRHTPRTPMRSVESGRKIPIRTCETLTVSGERSRRLRVFCPFQATSFDLSACRSCSRLLDAPSDPEEPGARIVCAAPPSSRPPPSAEAPVTFAAIAMGIHVGEAMATRVVCVRDEAPLETALAHVQGILVPVVDVDGALVGVLYRPDLVPAPLVETIEVRLRVALQAGVAADRMDPRAKAVHESSPLVEALQAMTSNRARALPVLADGGVVVGTLTDLDLLAWFGRARRQAGEGTRR